MFNKLVDADPELGRDFELRRRLSGRGREPVLSSAEPSMGEVRAEFEGSGAAGAARYSLPEGEARFSLLPLRGGDLLLRIELGNERGRRLAR